MKLGEILVPLKVMIIQLWVVRHKGPQQFFRGGGLKVQGSGPD